MDADVGVLERGKDLRAALEAELVGRFLIHQNGF